MPSTTVSHLPRISGYTVIEQIYSGVRTAVYRAKVEPSDRSTHSSIESVAERKIESVIIKVLQNPYPSARELAQFRNQYSITQSLSIPGIPRPLALKPWHNRYALITEDFNGVSLQRHIETRSRRATQQLVDTLQVGIQLCDLLHELGQHQIIHKDIKPANILIQPESQQIQLIDFSIASQLPKETQGVQSPNKLEGTLAYIAPEQTGRMNRAIDYRTDFYSLGVTLYELLTGQLPFQTTDSMALIHCHIAKVPTPPHQINNTPAMVSAVVLKLMSKNAEDRYQSALGIQHDLSKCLEQIVRTGDVAAFSLGEQDSSDRFSISEKLYGREQEVECLIEAYERIVSGAISTELMLVAGSSGMGKTVVINEVHKPLTRQQGYFIRGKFDQLNRNSPLSAILQAVQSLLTQVLTEPDEQVARKRQQVLAALGEDAQRLVEVIPELETLIGVQPAVPELSAAEAQSRFNALFQKFVSVFAEQARPLVLFLDDLQWIDLASLQLLQQLIEQQKHLLILGAYRENEVSSAHPFMQMIETIKPAASVTCLELSPLSVEETSRLVADTLHCSNGRAQPISTLIYRRTKGNPFFTTQFLKSLYEEGHIRFNQSKGTWECDIEKVSQLSFSDDVVDFLIQKLEKLPAETQNLLAIAACIGNRFSLSTLAIAAQKDPEETAQQLWVSLEAELIVPEEGVCAPYENQQNPIDQAAVSSSHHAAATDAAATQAKTYRFLHDRVQQAAYALIAEEAEQKQRTHLTIGRRLLNDSRLGTTDILDTTDLIKTDSLFEIVGHLNKGITLLKNSADSDAEQQQLVRLNLMAAEKAKASSDYPTALKCYCIGIGLLKENSWTQSYGLTCKLYQSAAEAALLAGNFEKMEAWADAVLQQATTPIDSAKAYEIKIQAANSQAQFLHAIAITKEALAPFGVTLPESPVPADIQQAFQATIGSLAEKDIAELANLPAMTSQEHIAIMRLTSAVLPAAFLGMPPLFPLLICIQIRNLIKHGNAPSSAYSYAAYGLLLNIILNDLETAQQFSQLAIGLVNESPSKNLQSQTYFVVATFITHHISHIKAAHQRLIQSYQLGLESGNQEYVGYSAYHICNNAYLMGTTLGGLKSSIEAYCQVLSKLNQTTTLNYCKMAYQAVLNLTDMPADDALAEAPSYQSKTIEPTDSHRSYARLQGTGFDEIAAVPLMQAENNITGLYTLYIHKLMLSFIFGEISAAQTISQQIQPYLAGGDGFSIKPLFYFYESLTALSARSACTEESISTAESMGTEEPIGAKEQDREPTEKPAQSEEWLSQVDDNQAKLKHWAQYAPMNYQHKVALVEAERHRVQGKPYAAMELYDQAIAGAKEHGFVQEEALANELAAKFYLARGRKQIAAGYLKEAYYGYSRWEAVAKVAQLENTYPQILSFTTAHSKNQAPNTQQTHTHQTLTPSTLRSVANTSSYQNMWLDFLSISKATQAISQEIQLDNLLETLMEIAVTNAGAQTGSFILSKSYLEANGEANKKANRKASADANSKASADTGLSNAQCSPAAWQVVTEANQAGISITHTSLEQNKNLPQSVICSVMRSEQPALFEDLRNNKAFEGDRYIISRQPLSALCMPVSRQGRLIGILYLENNAATGVFSSDRLQTLQLLTAQAAISLENAALYQQTERYSSQLEAEVSRKTQALNEKVSTLENTLAQLKETQAQLIQSEKMSSLGQLVAGVAHEINNPVNFIHANLKHIGRYNTELMEVVTLYQQHCHPHQPESVMDITEDIDLEFMAKDTQRLLVSMRNGSDRIKDIVLSLRNFSRLDEAVCKQADVHEGIESTLTLLQHRLKSTETNAHINVERCYGNLPTIQCYPGLLNQVFMNLLNNAIDALGEASNKSENAQPGKIKVSTELLEAGWIAVRIADSGIGILPEVRSRIFDPFFTTKPVGKGQGLGLSVSYQIVTDKHGGKLYCGDSQEGTEMVIELPTQRELNG